MPLSKAKLKLLLKVALDKTRYRKRTQTYVNDVMAKERKRK
jgi:hypothetical protein